MSNYYLIQIYDIDMGVVNIQLNSPDTQNTLSEKMIGELQQALDCLLYTSPSPRDSRKSRMPSSA